MGLPELKAQSRASKEAFPDLRSEILELVQEDNRLVAIVRLTGTHRGDFAGLAATGKEVAVTATNLFRLQDGRVLEDTPYWDFSALFHQLTS